MGEKENTKNTDYNGIKQIKQKEQEHEIWQLTENQIIGYGLNK